MSSHIIAYCFAGRMTRMAARPRYRSGPQHRADAVELRKIAQRGGAEHVAYGLYRFNDIPRTGKEDLMEAVLRVGEHAFLTRDSVLALRDLAMVNSRRIRVGTPHRVRPHLPIRSR